VALSVEEPAATPFKVNVPVLFPAGIANVDGDTPTSFAGELSSATATPPGPAGAPKVMLPLIVPPTLIEELGKVKEIPGEVTLNAALVEATRPGLVAARVSPLPMVAIRRLGNVAIPWTADTVADPVSAIAEFVLRASVIGFAAPVRRVPLLSTTLTAGAGAIVEPASEFAG
jgi:hypothetical protein